MQKQGLDENGKLLPGFKYAKGGAVVPCAKKKTKIKVLEIKTSQTSRIAPVFEHLILNRVPETKEIDSLEKKHRAKYVFKNNLPQLIRNQNVRNSK